MAPSLLVRGRRVALPAGTGPAAVLVEDGRILAVTAPEATGPAAADEVVELSDEQVLSPGAVDVHVHCNEPGRSDWEGFANATRAAAAGGITTLVDMPLNSVPATTSVAALAAKRAAARGRCHVDVAFWGGLVPGNEGELEPLWRAGVRGFKAFLCPSGVPELPAVGEPELELALPTLARLGAPLLVHAELPAHLGEVAPGERRHAAWVASRPPRAEAEAVAWLGELALRHGARIHVVHLSAAESLAELAASRVAGASISAETCPHYLAFADGEVPDGATLFKCAPPLRGPRHREALWRALLTGELAFVASDHSPSPPAGKHLEAGDFAAAWGGIAGLQLLLPATWSEGRARGAAIADLARWLGAAPAALAGLAGRKGAIARGADADLVVWEPERDFTVDPALLYHRHRATPWAGRRLAGVVRRTLLRGATVWRDGEHPGEPGGELL